MIYSYSRLNTFEQCPYKYKLKYIDKIETELPENIESFLGSRVHETLEKLYRDLEHQKVNTKEELIHYFKSRWKKNWSDNITIVQSQYNMNNYLRMGEKFIKDYFNHYHPFNQTKTISIEDRIIINLNESGEYRLQGYIDRLAERENGHYEIHDYKTNSRLPSIGQIKQDKQLALYAIGVKNQYPGVKTIDLIWHFLKFDKEITSTRTEKELKKLKAEIINLIKRIENTESFHTKPTALCNWCEYKSICPQWSNLYCINEKKENEYVIDNGVQLVDRYVKIKEKTRQMNLDLYAEIEKIEKAIIDYAKHNNIEVVYGSKKQVCIKKSEKYSLPTKGSKLREELKLELKKYGLWEKVEQLDSHALNRIIHQQSEDESLLNKIKKYLIYNEKKQLYISQRKNNNIKQ